MKKVLRGIAIAIGALAGLLIAWLTLVAVWAKGLKDDFDKLQ